MTTSHTVSTFKGIVANNFPARANEEKKDFSKAASLASTLAIKQHQGRWEINLHELMTSNKRKHLLIYEEKIVGKISNDENSVAIDAENNFLPMNIVGGARLKSLTINSSSELILDAKLEVEDVLVTAAQEKVSINQPMKCDRLVVEGESLDCVNNLYANAADIQVDNFNNKGFVQFNFFKGDIRNLNNHGKIDCKTATVKVQHLVLSKDAILHASVRSTWHVQFVDSAGKITINKSEFKAVTVSNKGKMQAKSAMIEIENLILSENAVLASSSSADEKEHVRSKLKIGFLDSSGKVVIKKSDLETTRVVNQNIFKLFSSSFKTAVFSGSKDSLLIIAAHSSFFATEWYKYGVVEISDHSNIHANFVFDHAKTMSADSKYVAESVHASSESSTVIKQGEMQSDFYTTQGSLTLTRSKMTAPSFNQEAGKLELNNSHLKSSVVTLAGQSQQLANKSVLSSGIIAIKQEIQLNESGIESKQLWVSGGQLSLQNHSAVVAEQHLKSDKPLVIDKSRLIAGNLIAEDAVSTDKSHLKLASTFIKKPSGPFNSRASHIQCDDLQLQGESYLKNSQLSSSDQISLRQATTYSDQSQLNANEINIDPQSIVQGNSLRLHADSLLVEGWISLDDYLEMAVNSFINFRGRISAAKRMHLAAEKYMINFLGSISSPHLITNSFIFANIFGTIHGQNHCDLNNIIGINALGLVSSYNLNCNSFWTQNILGLLTLSLPSNAEAVFSWQRLSSLARLCLMNAVPSLSKWINVSANAFSLLKSTSLMLYDAYSQGFFNDPISSLKQIGNKRFTDFLPTILLLKNIAINKKTCFPLILPELDIQWSDVSVIMPQQDALLANFSTVFGPMMNIEAIVSDNHGAILSHHLNYVDYLNTNTGLRVSTGSYTHLGHTIRNRGISNSAQLMMMADSLHNCGSITSRQKNWLEVDSIHNEVGSEFALTGGAIKTSQLFQDGKASIASMHLDCKEMIIGGKLEATSDFIEAYTVEIKRDAKLQTKDGLMSARTVSVKGDLETKNDLIAANSLHIGDGASSKLEKTHIQTDDFKLCPQGKLDVTRQTILEGKYSHLAGNVITTESLLKAEKLTTAITTRWEAVDTGVKSKQVDIVDGTQLTLPGHGTYDDMAIVAEEFKFAAGASINRDKNAVGSLDVTTKQGTFEGSAKLGNLTLNNETLSSEEVSTLLVDTNRLQIQDGMAITTQRVVTLNKPVDRQSSVSLTAASINNHTDFRSRQSITLKTTVGNIHNSGNMVTGKDFTLQAQGSITQHKGSLKSLRNLRAAALTGDFVNTGSRAEAERSLELEAAHDVINGCDAHYWRGSFDTEVTWTPSEIKGGTTAVTAGHDLNNDASVIRSKEGTKLFAGNDFQSTARSHTRVVNIHKRKRWGNVKKDPVRATQSLQPVIPCEQGDELIQTREGNVTLQGTIISVPPKRQIEIKSGGNVTLNAHIYEETSTTSKQRFFSSVMTTTTRQHAIPTRVNGNLKIQSKKDVNISGTQMADDLDCEADSIDISGTVLKTKTTTQGKKLSASLGLDGVTLSHQQTTTHSTSENLHPSTFHGEEMRLKARSVRLAMSAHISRLFVIAEEAIVYGQQLTSEEKSRSQSVSVTVNADGIRDASFQQTKSKAFHQHTVTSDLKVDELHLEVKKFTCQDATLHAKTASGHVEQTIHQQGLNRHEFNSRHIGIDTKGNIPLGYQKNHTGTVVGSQGLVVDDAKNLKVDSKQHVSATPYQHKSGMNGTIPAGKIIQAMQAAAASSHEDKSKEVKATDSKMKQNNENQQGKHIPSSNSSSTSKSKSTPAREAKSTRSFTSSPTLFQAPTATGNAASATKSDELTKLKDKRNLAEAASVGANAGGSYIPKPVKGFFATIARWVGYETEKTEARQSGLSEQEAKADALNKVTSQTLSDTGFAMAAAKTFGKRVGGFFTSYIDIVALNGRIHQNHPEIKQGFLKSCQLGSMEACEAYRDANLSEATAKAQDKLYEATEKVMNSVKNDMDKFDANPPYSNNPKEWPLSSVRRP